MGRHRGEYWWLLAQAYMREVITPVPDARRCEELEWLRRDAMKRPATLMVFEPHVLKLVSIPEVVSNDY